MISEAVVHGLGGVCVRNAPPSEERDHARVLLAQKSFSFALKYCRLGGRNPKGLERARLMDGARTSRGLRMFEAGFNAGN